MQQNMYYMQPDELDEDLNIDFKKIFMIFWSRKTLILKVFCSVLAFFILLTFIMPKKYKVNADLYINKSNNTNLVDINPYAIEELGAGGGMAALMSGASGGLSNELEIMQSPLVIDKVIRENNLVIKKKWGIIPNKKEGEYISTAAFLKKNISIENKKGTNVVTIEYKSKKPDVAYNIVCSIISNYIEVSRDLHTDKAKNDTQVLQKEYNKVKAGLNKQMNATSGLPQTAITGAGNLAALSGVSKSARQALSSIQGQYSSGAKSQVAVAEEEAKLTQIATKLQWAQMVQEMSDSSKVLVLKEPVQLRDFENSSPKLLMNIILGIVFGAIASLFAIILAEILDKKLSFSKLDENIIYNDNNNFFNIQKMLLENKEQNISCIIFNNPEQQIINLFSKFKNLDLIKADISEELVDSVAKADATILFAKVGKTDATLYKNIKEIIKKKNKPILEEVLV